VEQTLENLQESGIDYEVRTTVHNDLLNAYDVGHIIKNFNNMSMIKLTISKASSNQII